MSLIRQNKGMSLAAIGNNGAGAHDGVKEIKAIVRSEPTVRPVEARVITAAPTPAPAAASVAPAPSVSELEVLRAQLAQLQEENSHLKMSVELAQKLTRGGLSLKVSEKGAVSLYGMGRFPTTLYAEQWLKVCEMAGSIKEFIETNRSILKSKEQK